MTSSIPEHGGGDCKAQRSGRQRRPLARHGLDNGIAGNEEGARNHAISRFWRSVDLHRLILLVRALPITETFTETISRLHWLCAVLCFTNR
ncbi:MAG: hypothetical protein R3D83_01095 [Caenibius sp.]